MNKTPEYKKGLEIRLAQEGHDLHVSVGGDSHFMEAVLVCPEPVELDAPVYLDLNYLANFKFQTSHLHFLKPSTEKLAAKGEIEYRAHFKAENMSFKIPFRKGDVWAKNKYDHSTLENLPSITVTKKFLEENYDNLELPNSFSQKGPRLIILESKNLHEFIAYSSDDFGAFLHTFKDDNIQANFQRLKVLYEFLIPFKKISNFNHIRIAQSERLTVGHLLCEETSGIKKFCWVQPNWQKAFDPVPDALTELRSKVEWSLAFDSKALLSKVIQATQFYTEANYRENPLEFSAIQNKYGFIAKLPQSEVVVDGELTEPIQQPVRVKFQAACLRDYLSCFVSEANINLEIYRSTAVAYQALEGKNLLYWMPIHDR